MIEAIVAGLTLGTGSGAAPGPLMGMAISRTMRRGLLSGLRIAFAPLISDTLIILLSLTVVSQLSNQAISILGIVGAVVVAAFGIETLVSARKATLLSPDDTPPSRKGVDKLPDVLQGAAINVLNPAPWIFWITAGSTLLVDFWRESPPAAIAFLATFYLMLVGVKVVLVIALSRTRHRMSLRTYRGILVGSGVLLLVAAALLLVTHVL